MAVNVVRYRHGDEARWGVVQGSRVLAIEGTYETTRAFMLGGARRAFELAGAGDEGHGLGAVEVLSPITSDAQFLCQATNYHSHMKESGLDPQWSPFNVFFRKASSCLSSASAPIVLPSGVEFLDYEVELGLVLSSDVTQRVDVSWENLHEHVGALVVVNDVSARDVQLPEGQFYKGKSYRSFGPVGPYLTLVDRSDLKRFDELRLRLSVNGRERQNSLVTDMVHRPPETLSELSHFQDWRVGDLLATGTPGGCALQAPAWPLALLAQLVSPRRRQGLLRRVAASNGRRLTSGDVVEASIGTDDGEVNLGAQRNEVVRG